MATFSERLKELRTNSNISQKTLAEAVGFSERGIQNYELELRRPATEPLIALAEYFDVSIDYLLGLTDNPKRF
ncbi:helix-turn-helix transcriptional regulator [Chakrabartyella piscis]|uniref:helix-turn-helix domain-containing protein n=1 Tax=Chakrabartyella piscis TaxID=2918914 RepID=UPI002958C733|nr:helix-turn-helix transcriptional regulator [Chakrabartyella piscis]